MNIHPYTDYEWNTLTHVILKLDNKWDPTIFDYIIDDDDAGNDDWCDTIPDISTRHSESLFDSTGEYKHRHSIHGIDIIIIILKIEFSQMTQYVMMSMNIIHITHIKLIL